MNDHKNTLHVRQLSKRYKTRKVVKNVSLHVKRGEIVGLLGPNGAGKTTSFYMIVGLIGCDGGEIYFDNTDITTLPVHARARLGISYLPQEASIFRKLSVADNIMAILELRKDLNKIQRTEILNQLMQEFRIEHIRDNMGMSLSGGERRRVEIARALAIEPKFILLDEPFAGIDPISVLDVKEIIMHLRTRGIGVLITDHNVRETLDICERAYIVNQGEIICEGTPQIILENKQVRTVYLGENFNL
jgi:lipopolysaccharide export system ATP-binding protein